MENMNSNKTPNINHNETPPPANKRGAILLIILVLILVGALVGFFLYATRSVGNTPDADSASVAEQSSSVETFGDSNITVSPAAEMPSTSEPDSGIISNYDGNGNLTISAEFAPVVLYHGADETSVLEAADVTKLTVENGAVIYEMTDLEHAQLMNETYNAIYDRVMNTLAGPDYMNFTWASIGSDLTEYFIGVNADTLTETEKTITDCLFSYGLYYNELAGEPDAIVTVTFVNDANDDTIYETSSADARFTDAMAAEYIMAAEAQLAADGEATLEPEISDIFVDVAGDSYYAAPVLWAYNNGITSGTDAGIFSPEETCTRGQAITFLWRLAGEPAATTENPFTDVAPDSPYLNAILWAYEAGISSGTDEGIFSPDETVTRGQFVTFLWRLAGKPEASGTSFDDVTPESSYYTGVEWAVNQGITSGTDEGIFSPDEYCSRAQVVTFLYRYAESN